MIRRTENNAGQVAEPEGGRPAASGEAWLGHNRTDKRRVWERLNPRHRKEMRMLAEALALQQSHARLPEPTRSKLDAAVAEIERLARRISAIFAEVARRTPPEG